MARVLIGALCFVCLAGCGITPVPDSELSRLERRSRALRAECEELREALESKRQNLESQREAQVSEGSTSPAEDEFANDDLSEPKWEPSLWGQREPFRDSLEYRILVHSDAFLGAAVGESAETPTSARALRILLLRPWAHEALLALASEGTIAAQLYALCGFWYVDRAHYHELLPVYLESSGMVDYAPIGHYSTPRPVRSIANDIIEDEELREALIESDARLSSVGFEGEFTLERYRSHMERSVRVVPKLLEALAKAPLDEVDAFEALVGLGAVDRRALRRILRSMNDGESDVRDQAREILVALGPWTGRILPDVIALMEQARDVVVDEVLSLLLEESIWIHADYAVVDRFLARRFCARVAIEPVLLEEVDEVILEAVLVRTDLHRAPPGVLLWLFQSTEPDTRDEIIAFFLQQGASGTARILEIDRTATKDLMQALRESLGSPGIQPWLPPQLLDIAITPE